jgi:Mg2+/Co2+ transporter CorB
MAFVVLAVFVFVGIVFDIIGVAVTSASPKPFHSMASHREAGAAEALTLLRNAEKVSSFCNDVVGDISGIISGTTAAIIAARLMEDLSTESVLLQSSFPALSPASPSAEKPWGRRWPSTTTRRLCSLSAK